MEGLLSIFPLLLCILIFLVIFLAVKNYFYSHPSPTLKRVEEQNRASNYGVCIMKEKNERNERMHREPAIGEAVRFVLLAGIIIFGTYMIAAYKGWLIPEKGSIDRATALTGAFEMRDADSLRPVRFFLQPRELNPVRRYMTAGTSFIWGRSAMTTAEKNIPDCCWMKRIRVHRI